MQDSPTTQLSIGQTAIHEIPAETELDNSALSNPNESPIIYDLSGRRLNSHRPLPRGLYLLGGRKVIVP